LVNRLQTVNFSSSPSYLTNFSFTFAAMLDKLKQRWKVNTLNLVLIIATFALGGSLCGYAGRKILQFAGMDKGVLYIIVYIVLITLLWPVCVLIISVPLGQLGFFRRYLQRISKRVKGSKDSAVVNIAIFASGAGSNAQKIIEYFAASGKVKIALVVCNKPGAGVLDIAAGAGIPTALIEKNAFAGGDEVLALLKKYDIHLVVLAGFLLKVPEKVIRAFPKRIINIHPALLPKYGGKGMYGHYVHESVIANKETESGITIHFADELYDHGEIILQAHCTVDASDTPGTLAEKIHLLEHAHYAPEISRIAGNI